MEDRYNTIGLVHDVLFVVYTRKEKLRIISARLANEQESGRTWTFQSVILAGVYDIKNLKLIIRKTVFQD
ncbi:MAG: BrnT family toxin [Lachnospiraceae bacterium]|nr:BrnT family toxin [Lachnospiraceae bacterium]